MKKVVVENLIFEMGRMCNMCCDHCLRGPSQNKTLSLKTIYEVLNQCESIYSITFSGGEPTLYADNIIKTIDYIIAKNISCHGFYIVSNGKIINYKLLAKLAEFYGYCYECGGEVEYTCGYDISLDQFHEDIPKSNLSALKAYSFFGQRKNIPDDAIINMGNAYDYGIGRRNLVVEQVPFYLSNDDDCVDKLYINANGYAIPNCNFSYEVQDSYGAWSVNEKTLYDIINNFAKENIEDVQQLVA